MKTYEQRTEDVLNRAETKRRRRKRIITGTAIGLCAALIVGGNVALFLPTSSFKQDLSAYKDSEYYSLMNQINDLTYREPTYKNNFEMLLDSVLPKYGASEPDISASDGADMSTSNESYEEVTLNQTSGVIEGDLFKRSSEYIYYLSDESPYSAVTLHIYSIEGENSRQVSEYGINPEEGVSYYGYEQSTEMYLSEDCNSVTVVTQCYYEGTRQTAIITLDVSDPENIVQLPTQFVKGSLVSSRMIDGDLLIINDYYIYDNPDFSQPEEFLPSCGSADDIQVFEMADIVAPDNATSAKYTVICRYDVQENAFCDNVALFSYSDEAYVSGENVFVTRRYFKETDDDLPAYDITKRTTEISCISYADGGLNYISSVCVDGEINDRYSMDEYEGVLRVFTTTYMAVNGTNYVGDPYVYYASSASLFCIDLESFEIIASVKNFAPENDSVQSARFDGAKAYVCTAIEYMMTDPVYVFDLSDYDNITYVDSGIISGYSTSLITFKDNTLLGIGYGDNILMLKIELYDADTAQSVTKYEENAQFSTEFKSYYINSQEGLIGLAISHEGDPDVKGWSSDYLLLRFDGYGLVPVLLESLDSAYLANVRATLIDGYLYIFSGEQFIVKSI
ncbi:MAG: beta-propeller domain-containing protein [Candidatus Coproplasma sp.]